MSTDVSACCCCCWFFFMFCCTLWFYFSFCRLFSLCRLSWYACMRCAFRVHLMCVMCDPFYQEKCYWKNTKHNTIDGLCIYVLMKWGTESVVSNNNNKNDRKYDCIYYYYYYSLFNFYFKSLFIFLSHFWISVYFPYCVHHFILKRFQSNAFKLNHDEVLYCSWISLNVCLSLICDVTTWRIFVFHGFANSAFDDDYTKSSKQVSILEQAAPTCRYFCAIYFCWFTHSNLLRCFRSIWH